MSLPLQSLWRPSTQERIYTGSGSLKLPRMEYCPNCGNLLLPKRRNGSALLVCLRCGYEKTMSNPTSYKITRQTKHGPENAILVIDREVRVETLPKTRVECPRCGNIEAYYWEVQTRAGDEPATRFFRCTKCSYTWREYQ